MPDGRTVGIWVGEDSDLVERFDDELGRTDPGYSRSEKIKDAMELYLQVQDTLDQLDYEFPKEPAKRHFVRQAIFTQDRMESE